MRNFAAGKLDDMPVLEALLQETVSASYGAPVWDYDYGFAGAEEWAGTIYGLLVIELPTNLTSDEFAGEDAEEAHRAFINSDHSEKALTEACLDATRRRILRKASWEVISQHKPVIEEALERVGQPRPEKIGVALLAEALLETETILKETHRRDAFLHKLGAALHKRLIERIVGVGS